MAATVELAITGVTEAPVVMDIKAVMGEMAVTVAKDMTILPVMRNRLKAGTAVMVAKEAIVMIWVVIKSLAMAETVVMVVIQELSAEAVLEEMAVMAT